MATKDGSGLMSRPPPPGNVDDNLIAEALIASSPSLLNADPRYPLGIPPPSPDAPDEYDGANLLRLYSICLVFIIGVTVFRLCIRGFHRGLSFGWDDWLVIPAALTAASYVSLGLAMAKGGCIGRHIYYCTYQNYNHAVVVIYVLQSIFYFAVYCAKMSIVLFNRRLTALTSSRWNIVHWVYFAGILICGLLSCCLVIFNCHPVGAHYNLITLAEAAEKKDLKCLDQKKLQVALRALHIGTDLALLCIPIYVVTGLQLPLRKKIQMVALFSIGSMTCIASVMRNVVANRLPSDFPYDGYQLFAWDAVDVTFAIVVASLPVFSGILDRLITSTTTFLSMSRSSTGRSTVKSSRNVFLHPLSNAKKSRDTTDCEPLGDEYGANGGRTTIYAMENQARDKDPVGIHRTDDFELNSVETLPGAHRLKGDIEEGEVERRMQVANTKLPLQGFVRKADMMNVEPG